MPAGFCGARDDARERGLRPQALPEVGPKLLARACMRRAWQRRNVLRPEKQRLEATSVEQATLLRALEQATHVTRSVGREVENGTRRRSHRDSLDGRQILGLERGEVDDDPLLAVAPRRRGEVEGARLVAQQSPDPARGDVTGDGRLVGEHRRHAPPVPAECFVPDRVDAPVQAMELPVLHPASDRPRREPELHQLARRDHAVLPLCQLGHRLPVVRSSLLPHTATRDERTSTPPPGLGTKSDYATAAGSPRSARSAVAALRPFRAMTLPAGWVAAPHI